MFKRFIKKYAPGNPGSIFGSSLKRQVIVLLLLCGIFPLFLFAFPLYFQTHRMVEEEARQSLKKNVQFAASQLTQKLNVGADQLTALAGQSGNPPGSTSFFDRLRVVRKRTEIRRGRGLPWATIQKARMERLAEGEVILSPPYRHHYRAAVTLITRRSDGKYLIGEIKPGKLWNVAQSSYFGPTDKLFVIDRSGRVLAARTNRPIEPLRSFGSLFSRQIPPNHFGHGEAQLKDEGPVYWVSKPFNVEGRFGAGSWNLVVMRRAQAVETMPMYLLKSLVLWLGLALIGLVMLALPLARRLHDPISDLTRATRRLAEGDWSSELPVEADGEIGELARSFRNMRTELKESQEKLRYEALHDQLTGLPNRVLLEDRLRQNIEYARRREDYSFAVLFLDVDRFKIVNDSLGHDVGDDLLKAFGERVENSLRSADTLARIGGDEFVAILDDVSSPQQARKFAQRIHDKLTEPFSIDDHEVFARASMGILLHDEAYSEPEEILRDADTAMYKAKDLDGSSPYVIFGQSMRKRVQDRLSLETELQHATRNNDFLLHYQPILNLKEGRVEGCEVLLRWNHSDYGWVSPATFIPIAEETDLINRIGEWTLMEAGKTLASWRARYDDLPLNWISVNVSAHQLTSFDLLEHMTAVLEGTGLNPGNFKLEVTESALIQSTEFALESLKDLRDRGFSICMDDFGTGYSSLAMVNDLPLDVLKVDLQFIRNVHRKKPNQAIVEAVSAMAPRLNLSLIAEGIEEREELRYLMENTECNYGQGYLFSKPVDREQLIELIPRNGSDENNEAFPFVSKQLGIFT